MRKYLFLLMAFAVLADCEKSPSSPKLKERKDIVLTKSQKEVFSKGNTFAFNLLKEVYPRDTKQEVFISPLSMSCALSMLSNGASGKTFSEIANALYFKGIWTTKFPESGTKPMPFHSLGGKDVTKDFMNAELPCKLGYSTELSAKMCELTFGNKAFVFDILLPDENVDFDAFVAGLDAEKWDSAISKLSSQEDLRVSIPKMDLSFTAERNILIPALQSLGIVSAFNASADFSAMSNIAVFIDSVIQKTRFRMDEDGAEAAAVTVITGRNLASGEPFIADHPFVYAIREISTNTILFLGAYRGLE